MELVFDTRINLSTMFIHLIYALPSHLMRKKKSFNCREQLIRNDEIPLHSTKYKIITFHEIRDDPLSIWVYFLLKLKMGIFHLNIDWKKKAKLDFSRFLPFFMHLRMFFPREKKTQFSKSNTNICCFQYNINTHYTHHRLCRINDFGNRGR